METKNIKSKNTHPLIVIVGQTASGKSDFAVQIANKHNGEIICADSRTIYKGMDIGTAKPSVADRRSIKHYLLDVIDPNQTYSASDFKEEAFASLKAIYSRGKLPIVVGGTGLYVNSLIYDFDFGRPPDLTYREKLQKLDTLSLQGKVRNMGITEKQVNFKNRRHLIRLIENKGIVRSKKPLNKNTLLLGIQIDPQELRKRIDARNENMISEGLEAEVKTLVKKYGWDAPGLNAIGYKEWKGYFDGEQDVNEVKENMFRDNWQYARRQKIWFKKDQEIKWSASVEDLIRQVDQFLIQY